MCVEGEFVLLVMVWDDAFGVCCDGDACLWVRGASGGGGGGVTGDGDCWVVVMVVCFMFLTRVDFFSVVLMF